ncbi:ATP-binding protein [Phenylobacterium sp.]|uniref:ATP-binding protein n=1 Tax=Phenylobacterium sp. TaxID=1871053 RepID=UPI00272F0300|nr:ATP-binding protein [Phenylobacterium sp.]MDP2212292.1 ATP-binding protein [Phenylobacterium sp.]
MRGAPAISRGSRLALIAAVLCGCYVSNLWLTNVLRETTGVGTLWTANAFVIGAILLLPARWAPACLAVGFILQVAVILAFGHPLYGAVGYSLLNVIEAVAIVYLARRLNAVRLTTPARFAALIFLALAPVLVIAALLLGLGALVIEGEFPAAMLINRLGAKFLGMSLVLPAILLLSQGRRTRLVSERSLEITLGYVAVAVLVALIITPAAPIALLAMFPVITILGLRTGPQAVTVAMAVACVVLLTVGFLWGRTPVLAETQTLNQQVTIFQVYLGLVFGTGIVTALMAIHQQRLRDLILRRSISHQRARERAEAASVAKTDFLATMSHEIRTPLNSIIGFAQVLERDREMRADSRRQIDLIRRSGIALLTVVNDILDFSKVEAGRIELDPKPVDLTAVCQDALAIVTEAAEGKGLALTMVVVGETAAAHVCDDHRLCQVLLNYLNNAVKFTDAGEVTLTLTVTPEGDRDRVRISVADTGVGIAPAAAARLFQRFSQVDSSVSRTHGGSGLGLAICKGLIEAMGGQVGVESAPGAGSTFWLELALERSHDLAPVTADTGEGQALAAHVLLVDDHPMNRELGVLMLQILGCTADVACDGREAIEAAKSGAYDAILMDVHMPVVDGLAATRAIRALEGHIGRVPIIAMSADVLPEQITRMREAGMVDSVGKPVKIEDLRACLARWTCAAAGEAAAA